MLEFKELLQLMKAAARANSSAPTTYRIKRTLWF